MFPPRQKSPARTMPTRRGHLFLESLEDRNAPLNLSLGTGLSGLTLGGIALGMLGSPDELGAGDVVQSRVLSQSSPVLDQAGQLAVVQPQASGLTWAATAASQPDSVRWVSTRGADHAGEVQPASDLPALDSEGEPAPAAASQARTTPAVTWANNFAATDGAGIRAPGRPALLGGTSPGVISVPTNWAATDAPVLANSQAAAAATTAVGPQVQPTGTIAGQTAVSNPQFAQADPTPTAPKLSADQIAAVQEGQARGALPTPAIPFDATGKPADVPATAPDLGQRDSFTDFGLYRNTADTASPSRSTTGENAVGTIGRASFMSGAFYGTVSGDYGANFAYVNPAIFPATGDYSGGYDGFSRVATDLNRGMVMWELEYNKSGSTSSNIGGVRIAVATNVNELLDSAWTYYNWTPDLFGQGRGVWMNWPQMQVSNNYLYASSNVYFTTNNAYKTTILWRMSLADIQAKTSVHYTYWIVNNGSSLPLSSNATSVMYSASLINSTSMRVFNQPENSTNLNWNDKSGLGQTYSGTHTSITVGNVNWTALSDERMQSAVVFQGYVVFMWNSAQGSGRPQPFVRARIFRTSDLSGLDADLWFGSYAWHWGSLAGTDAGFAGTVYVGGPGLAPQVNVLLQDLYSNPLVPPPWTNFGVVGGNTAAAFGHYTAVAVDSVDHSTFVGGASVMNNGTPTPYYFWFGRQGYDPHRPVPRPHVGETLATALNTNIGPLTGTFTYTNEIWSPSSGRRGVGLYRVQANAGTTLYALTTPQLGTGDSFNAVVRLFNSSGTQLAAVDPNSPVALLQYKITSTGTYYIGISGHGNAFYNPNVAASGALAAIGDYSLTLLINPVPTTTFRVTTTAANPLIAGTSFSVTVAALDSTGAVNPSYRGTVHFSSGDTLATLPGNYTFTAGDNGVHTFPLGATFRKFGPEAITASDTASSFIAGTSPLVVVLPAAAARFQVSSYPSPITAGKIGYFLVSVFDAYGNPAFLYQGKVQLTSSDAKAQFLPATYTFRPVADFGFHLFFAELKTAGTQSITISDVNNDALTATISDITVQPAAASHFRIDAPTPVTSGTPFDVTVTALDPYDNVDPTYQGTVSWRTTDMDPGVVVPDDYTFTTGDGGDNGVHTFPGGMTLITPGFVVLQASDPDNNIQGLGLVRVVAADGGAGNRGTLAALADPAAVPTLPAASALPVEDTPMVSPARAGAAPFVPVPAWDGLPIGMLPGEETLSHWLTRPLSETAGVTLLDDGLVDLAHTSGVPGW